MDTDERFSKVYGHAVSHRDTEVRESYPQLDDGGVWFACAECGNHSRHQSDSIVGEWVCHDCCEITDHYAERPSYAEGV